jgi:hypothetical protein
LTVIPVEVKEQMDQLGYNQHGQNTVLIKLHLKRASQMEISGAKVA